MIKLSLGRGVKVPKLRLHARHRFHCEVVAIPRAAAPVETQTPVERELIANCAEAALVCLRRRRFTDLRRKVEV